MAATYYDPAVALLSPAAVALGAALDDYADVATDVLGLWATNFSGESHERAERAVALQVNHMVAQQDAVGSIRSITRGKRSVTYATSQAGKLFELDGAAQAIADNLLASSRYEPVTSFR